jgi:hypothetical protein
MANKTIPIEDKNYNIAPLTFGQGKELFAGADPKADINTPLLRYSLNNAGTTYADADIDAIPYPHAMQLIPACLEINGLRRPKQGEDQPAKAQE